MNTYTLGRWVMAVLLAVPAFASAQVNSLPSQPHLPDRAMSPSPCC
jgi:hypothetical protein